MAQPKQSRTTGELIPAVIFEFRTWNNLVMTKDNYNYCGGYRGHLKAIGIPVGELKKVHHLLLNPNDFPSAEWEP